MLKKSWNKQLAQHRTNCLKFLPEKIMEQTTSEQHGNMMGVYNLHVSWNMEDVCYGHLRRILASVAVFEHFLDIFRV